MKTSQIRMPLGATSRLMRGSMTNLPEGEGEAPGTNRVDASKSIAILIGCVEREMSLKEFWESVTAAGRISGPRPILAGSNFYGAAEKLCRLCSHALIPNVRQELG